TTFSGQPVSAVMGRAFPVTIRLAIYAIIIEAVLGIAAGVVAGVRRGGIFDSTVLVVSLVVISVPTFVIGFVLQFLFGVKWGIFPTTVGAHVSLKSLTLPAFVLGAQSLAYVLRLTRQSISEHVNADFVRTARAKGMTGGSVMQHHVLRNSLIPVVTFLGGDLGALMGGAIVTEGIFNVPGIGNALWLAILKGEPATVVSITTVLVLVYIFANLVVDLLYAWLDPRIRYE
ncbi:MAG: ABC transporter permease, partial [Actinomyces sp.]